MTMNNDEIIGQLYKPLFNGFTFVIPKKLVETEKGKNIIRFFGHELNEEFLEKYVDVFLFINDNLDIEELPIDESEVINIKKKIIELLKNIESLANLKDSVGKSNFKYIFETYLDKVSTLLSGCDALIENYHLFYDIDEDDSRYLFKNQKLIYETHLKELKKVFIAKNKSVKNEDFYNNLLKSFMELPTVKKDFEDFLKGKYSKNKKPEIIKPLRDFIAHDNNIEIENIVKKHLSYLRGVTLRYLIEYFIEKKVLALPNGTKTELCSSFKILFDGKDIADRNSIFGSKVFKGIDDTDYKEMKKVFDNLFQKYFSP